jgi:hypothetical protein
MIRLHKVNRHFERTSIHRLIFDWDWLDNGLWFVSVSWGDRHADPVWLIELQFTTAKYEGAS